jgi:hypothetical protein
MLLASAEQQLRGVFGARRTGRGAAAVSGKSREAAANGFPRASIPTFASDCLRHFVGDGATAAVDPELPLDFRKIGHLDRSMAVVSAVICPR